MFGSAYSAITELLVALDYIYIYILLMKTCCGNYAKKRRRSLRLQNSFATLTNLLYEISIYKRTWIYYGMTITPLCCPNMKTKRAVGYYHMF